MSLPPLKFVKSPNFSARTARVDLLVLHDTEGTYDSAISWFSTPKSNVSAHYVIKEDGSEVTQMVELADKAWHAVAFNSRSIGFEMAGFASKGFDSNEWDVVANILAYHLHLLQIPCQWSRGGVGPGFCSHFDLGSAGGGHSDPTTDVNLWNQFVSLVNYKYNVADFPSLWRPSSETPTKCSLAPLPETKGDNNA